ncbi:6-phospho-3-hexuloisomerase [Pectinatus haikarae]|uniref:6-phospho-3-hexuloisomerase n=1 Tax=Pectinatus haikarae TaxID=349096 RepID=A0ABT9Y7S1_9FIRM|nr:6-phospho-3-hexuloisomerase [Pectinatus haikarae]MDQ0203884.1 6-phospho-3-hexuloisomerase [Pectinatus haikarae]
MTYETARSLVIEECSTALAKVDEKDVNQLIDMILHADKIFLIGVGRVKLELEAFAKRLVHLGIKAHMVGDITEPAMTDRDILIVGSGSGESLIPVAIAKKAKQIGGKIVHIGSNPQSSLSPVTDLMVRIPVQTKLYLADEITSKQPMSSLFEQSLLLLCDTVAAMIVNDKHIELKKLWHYHANLE